MLARLFYRPDVRRRLAASPLGELLEAYATSLYACGYHRSTMRDYVWAVEHFGSWLRARRLSAPDVSPERVRSFLREHLPTCRCPAPAPACLGHVRPALNHLLRLLREQGKGASSSLPSTPIGAAVAHFCLHLRDRGGLSEATCQTRVRYVRAFLQQKFGRGALRWQAVRPGDGAPFVAAYARRGRPASAQAAADALRSFFRSLQFHGWCGPALAAAVPRVPHGRLARLPRTMTDAQLRAFLATFDRGTATGRRDYALALCQVVLGLRGSEVAGLCLADLDWRRATPRRAAGKANRARELPLPARVGQALAQYLRRGRPATRCRNAFVRHRVPRGAPATTPLIRGVMRRAFAKVEGCGRWTGTHVLRHTAATRMPRHGASLKEIADVLGHRCLDTTALYAKVDLPSLAAVALPWPEVQP
jgi:integrase/recombinase XerD